VRLIILILLCLAARMCAYDIAPTVQADTLKNGLRVLIVPDTNVAVIACRLYYFVGSMYEGPGTTGLSHMYEHMLFKGTKILGTTNYQKEKPIIGRIDSLEAVLVGMRNRLVPAQDSTQAFIRKQIDEQLEKERQFIKKDEIWELYQNNGGANLNAWTSDDMTAYYVTLPKNKIELFYWIESDRMRDPILREFDSERDVVAEERRMRYENQPLGSYWERLSALFYIAHPYRNPTIGWMSDIQSFTRKKLEAHVKRYYTPDNAVLVLAGNIDSASAMKNIRRYFDPIPRAAQPKEEVVTREPDAIGETRFILYDNAEPRIDILYHTPGFPSQDLYALDVVQGILSGRSGRLYQKLVEKERLCTDAGAENSIRLHNGEFEVFAELKDNTDPRKVETLLDEEISQLAAEPPSAREMVRIINDIRMSFVGGLRSLEGMANELAYFQRLGDWRHMLEYPEKIAKIKREDIPAVVKKYLVTDKRTIGTLIKKK